MRQLSESVPFDRIIKHFATDQITVGEMHDQLFDFITRETTRGTYLKQNHCLLFKKTPAEAKEEQEQEQKFKTAPVCEM